MTATIRVSQDHARADALQLTSALEPEKLEKLIDGLAPHSVSFGKEVKLGTRDLTDISKEIAMELVKTKSDVKRVADTATNGTANSKKPSRQLLCFASKIRNGTAAERALLGVP